MNTTIARLAKPVARTLALLLGLAVSGPQVLAQQRLQAVSPGSTAAPEPLAGSCPTFSWSDVAGASGYELVLYRIHENQDLETELQIGVPAGASSWTPSAAQCPASDSQYAWAVRALTENGPGAWSEPLLFATAGVPNEDELRQALDTLRRYREDWGGAAGEGLAPSLALPQDQDPLGTQARRNLPRDGIPQPTTQNPELGRPGGLEALSTPTVANAPSPQTVNPPAAFSLSLDGDLNLGGFVFKDGDPFIHNDGGATYRNTAVGIGALASATPGSPNDFHGRSNSAFGDGALSSNVTGHDNTASGSLALYSNTTGFHNTASGSSALYSNTTGINNTASGYQALYSNTEGFHNTASGLWALFANTVGSRNTASGTYALYSNTEGVNNTASGSQTLVKNTTGYHNTASGFGALFFNSTAGYNTATGSFALFNNITGVRNTASGVRALSSNTTGHRDTASGYRALYSNSEGFRNTAIGNQALEANTEGHYNTASGDLALLFNTTGSRNTAIGFQAGANWTTGDKNIAVGTGALGIAGESGVIRIGGDNLQTQTFIDGISGTTVSGVQVMITAGDQLGVAASSARFKQDIRALEGVSDRLLELRPVSFRYKASASNAEASANPIEYGLIAEEAAEIFPELVIYDEEGRPYTVRYHLLTPLLLGEIQRQEAGLRGLDSELLELRRQMANRDRDYRRTITDLKQRLDRLVKKNRFVRDRVKP